MQRVYLRIKKSFDLASPKRTGLIFVSGKALAAGFRKFTGG